MAEMAKRQSLSSQLRHRIPSSPLCLCHSFRLIVCTTLNLIIIWLKCRLAGGVGTAKKMKWHHGLQIETMQSNVDTTSPSGHHNYILHLTFCVILRCVFISTVVTMQNTPSLQLLFSDLLPASKQVHAHLEEFCRSEIWIDSCQGVKSSTYQTSSHTTKLIQREFDFIWLLNRSRVGKFP